MLLNLHVKNLALIEEVDVDFEKGLIVLTGETGAGKSLILGSVNIALGNKASKDMIRKGTDYSLVELTFSVSETCAKQLKKYDIYMEEDNIITVTRKISEGRSVSKINGETVNIKTLKNVMSLLIDIHGQHDHQSLLYTKNHLDILDKFAREQYQQYIYINMIGESGEYFLECYEKAYHRRNVQDEAENGMAAVLKTYAPNFVDSRETIVVIDEIQESPVIYSRIREFAREFSCDFIVTGSYLGKTREKEFFLSAGDTDTLVMGTLSFPEFLGAFGKRDLYETLTLDGKDDHARYDEIKDYFDLYCQLGGYPRVVQNYLETEDLSQSRRLVERIIDIFIKESSRYFESELDIEIFGQLFQAIAIMLLKEKRGTEDLVTDLSKIVFKEESGRVSKKMINHARSWLYLSHVIGYCSKSINCDHLSIVDNCRYYYMDLGVAAYFLRKTGEPDTAIKGILCENFVYLELLNRLRNTDSIAGTVPWFAVYQQTGGVLDFYVRSLLDYKNYGLEVKAGKSAGNTASTLLEAGLLDFLYYLKGNTYGGITEDGKIQTVPLYLAGRIRFDKGV